MWRRLPDLGRRLAAARAPMAPSPGTIGRHVAPSPYFRAPKLGRRLPNLHYSYITLHACHCALPVPTPGWLSPEGVRLSVFISLLTFSIGHAARAHGQGAGLGLGNRGLGPLGGRRAPWAAAGRRIEPTNIGENG